MSKMKLLLDVVQDLRSLATGLEALAGAISAPDAASELETSAAPQAAAPGVEPKPNSVEPRAFVAERSTPENRPQIKAILSSFGVNKLTELREEQYAEVMREVSAL